MFIRRELPVVEGLRTEETIERVASYHTLSTDVGKVAVRSGAKWLALTHFVPPEFDRAALRDEVARDFPGPVTIGEDLMMLDVASREVRYRGEVQILGE